MVRRGFVPIVVVVGSVLAQGCGLLKAPNREPAGGEISRSMALAGDAGACGVDVEDPSMVMSKGANFAESMSAVNLEVIPVVVGGAGANCTQAQLQETIFDGPLSVANYYRRTSFNHVQISGYVRPPVNAGAFNCSIQSLRALTDSIPSSGATHRMIILPANAGCDWAGLAEINGTKSWIRGDVCQYRSVIAHEFGHNLGFGHATAEYAAPGGDFEQAYPSYRPDASDLMTPVMGTASPFRLSAARALSQSWIQAPALGAAGSFTLSSLSQAGTSAPANAARSINVAGQQWVVSYRRTPADEYNWPEFEAKLFIHRAGSPYSGADMHRVAVLSLDERFAIPGAGQDLILTAAGDEATVCLAPTGESCASTPGPGSVPWKVDQWGMAGDRAFAGKFYSNAREDLVIYRPSTSTFWIKQVFQPNTQPAMQAIQWGQPGDEPFVINHEMGVSQVGVFRAGMWYIHGGESFQFGQAGDKPLVGRFLGPNPSVAVYRPSNGTIYIRKPDASWHAMQWGISDDQPVVGDFLNVGRDQIAQYRPSNGFWYIANPGAIFEGGPGAQFHYAQWGTAEDIPVPGRYLAGSSCTQLAVWRPSTGTFWVAGSIAECGSIRVMQWGQAGDQPLALDAEGNGAQNPTVFRDSGNPYGVWWIHDDF